MFMLRSKRLLRKLRSRPHNKTSESQAPRPETSEARFLLPVVATEGAAGAMGGDRVESVVMPPIYALVRDFNPPSGMRWGHLLPIGSGFRFFTSKGTPGLDDIIEHLNLTLSVNTPDGVVSGQGLRVGFLHYGACGAKR